MPQPKQLHLGLFLFNSGNHIAAWRHPGAEAPAGADVQRYARLVQTAERGKFDIVFIADTLGIRERGSPEVMARSDHVSFLEPLTLMSALAMVTTHIGLVATSSTTFNEPYNIARKFASLDHISGGRAGWNLVTSYAEIEARNFGRTLPAHSDRYARALESLEVVRKLWDTWDDDAFVADRAAGLFTRVGSLHPAAHRGEH